MKLIDTNILIRFFTEEDETLSRKAKKLLLTTDVYLDEVIVAETIWVLTTHYEKSKEDVVESLRLFLSREKVHNKRKEAILNALTLYNVNNIGFVDAWLLAVKGELDYELETFDKALQKLGRKG